MADIKYTAHVTCDTCGTEVQAQVDAMQVQDGVRPAPAGWIAIGSREHRFTTPRFLFCTEACSSLGEAAETQRRIEQARESTKALWATAMVAP